MSLIQFLFVLYGVLIFSYLLNVLITELPLDNRYQKLRVHFSIRRFLSLIYYPVIYWMTSGFREFSYYLKIRHMVVCLFSAGLFLTHFLGYTFLTPGIHFIVFSYDGDDDDDDGAPQCPNVYPGPTRLGEEVMVTPCPVTWAVS